MDIIPYAGWKKCVRLSNGTIELVATTEVGPRILRFGFVGGPNEFVEYPDQLGQTGGAAYRSYGGHRLWVAPETEGWTNHPDNRPVAVSDENGDCVLTPPVEEGTGLQKQIRVRLLSDPAAVRVEHRITNRGSSSTTLAPWALSVMAPGGMAVIPHEPFIPHGKKVLPAGPVVLWHYTDMTDDRWTWGKRFIILRHSSSSSSPQKAGALITEGWGAYVNGERLFLKRFPYDAEAKYPDFGVNAEFFTNARMLEVETLGPLRTLRTDETAVHVEHWFLFRGIRFPPDDDGRERLMAELLHHSPAPA